MIRIIMDEGFPPFIRDSRLFMYPFFWYWFKGKNLKLYMDFKKIAYTLTEEEFNNVYANLDCRATDRPTDLNDRSISFMLENLDKDATSLLDVGCGRGHWLNILKEKTKLELTGCDVFEKIDIEGVKYQKGAIEKLPFSDNQFDIVTCHHTIEHIRELNQAISELKRVAKKQLIIVTPKQRYYYFTLDLHLHFFPIQQQLTNLIGLEEFACENCDGDWAFIGKMTKKVWST